jgi:four helix bundle protein
MKNTSIESNPILVLTFNFSLQIIDYCEKLDELKKYHLSKQLFRSGTSIGANANEAQDGESKADFIHKFKIAAKEMKETKYWLKLCQQSKSYPDTEYLLQKLFEIEKVINKIIASSKRQHPLSYFMSIFIF